MTLIEFNRHEKTPGISRGGFFIWNEVIRNLMILFAVALLAFALQLAIAADCFRLLTCFLYRRLFVVTAQFHLAEETFALHLFLERAQSLIDVIIAYDDLYDGNHPFPIKSRTTVVFRPAEVLLTQPPRENKALNEISDGARPRRKAAAAQHTDFPCYFAQKI